MKPAEPDRMVGSLRINHRKLPPADYSRKVAQHLGIQRRRWLYPSASLVRNHHERHAIFSRTEPFGERLLQHITQYFFKVVSLYVGR